MADLIAQGPGSGEHWRRPLPEGRAVVLGREADWDVPWERFLSRRHAELTWQDGRLAVRRLPSGHNPLFTQGEAADSLLLQPGEHFVLGTTTLTVSQRPDSSRTEHAVLEATISAPELQRMAFRDAPHRLDVLSRLPEVISGVANDAELFPRLVSMLLAGMPRADVVALLAPGPTAPAEVLHWDRRLGTGGDFVPSARLVGDALTKQKQTVLHVWAGPAGESGPCDWAFCTPVPGGATSGWGIYVGGRLAAGAGVLKGKDGGLGESALGDDLKFTELVAAVLGSLRQLQALQKRQASLSQFFSPAVLRTLAEGDPEEVLRPREADLTVLFCDLRGFSREAERNADDLPALLKRVSQALGVMTQNILDQDGVIGDFHGDAAMGFWGWPLPQSNAVDRACQAALAIRTYFEAVGRRPGDPLAGFRVGIGIASGRAIAGKIGSVNQVKVTVFGPVVNLASRLEGMTKILRAQVLMDEATARLVRERGLGRVARWRRVARVKPYGLATPLVATELLPPLSEYPELTDAHLADYEAAVDAFEGGQWGKAYDLLRRMPACDRVPDFLTVLIARHDRRAPTNWSGVVELESKTA
jgi:adenylate cyclase